MAATATTHGEPRALPLAGSALGLVGAAAAIVVLLLTVHDRLWSAMPPELLPVPWLVAAALAVRARPGHRGALYFLGFGVGHLTAFALTQQLADDPGVHGWGPWVLALLATILYLGGFASLGAFFATYPDGRAESGPERWFVRGAFALAALAGVLAPLTSSPVMLPATGVRDSMAAPPGLPLIRSGLPFVAVGPIAVLVGVVLLIARTRRTTGEQRRQLSWAVGSAALLGLLLLAAVPMAAVAPSLQTATFVTLASVIPFALLAGLARFRLMEVDLYVARTLARGAVVVLVLAAYAVLTAVVGRDPTAAAGLAVVAALTGIPVVRRLERWIDRWLSGGRVRGAALLQRLSDELAVPSRESQARRTVDTVRTSLDATWVRLTAAGLDVVSGSVSGSPELDLPLLAGDVEVGRLACGPRHGGWGRAEVAEVALLARHAGLALHTAALTLRLEQQVVEIADSRRRIVRAEIAVRQRLERDLHDGVQQQVVAMIAHLGALKVLLPRGSRAAEVVATTHEQATATLVDLRGVVEGVQPPVLLDQGLEQALRSRAALLPVPVVVRLEPGAPARWSSDAEAAAYYVATEALTNVVKHAAASRAEVTIGGDRQRLRVSVCDDGRGFEAASESRGSGLRGLRDRVEALDGRFEVTSGPSGTTVRAELPAGSEHA